MNHVSEIYNCDYGRILYLDKLETTRKEIAQELLSWGKVGIITSHMSANQWVVQVTTDLKPGDFVDLLDYSNFMDSDDFTYPVPETINKISLRVSIYNKLKEKKLTRSVYITKEGVRIHSKKEMNTIAKELALIASLKEEKVIHLDENVDATKYISKLYKEAKKLGLIISVKDFRPAIGIKVTGTIINKPKKKSLRSTVLEFIDAIPYDSEVKLPVNILAECNLSYMMVVCSKSQFDISFKNGMLCKHSHRIRRINGRVVLRLRGDTLHIFDKPEKPSDMKEKHWKMVDIILSTYGLSRYDS